LQWTQDGKALGYAIECERHLTQTQVGMTPDSESAVCDLFAVQSDKTVWQKHFTGSIFD